MSGLAGVRVVEWGSSVAGSFAGRLLAGFGATVVKIEPPGGDPLRLAGPFRGDVPHPEAGGLFLYLNAGKQSVVLDSRDREQLLHLAGNSDIVLASGSPADIEASGLIGLVERSVVTAITPFGLTGPYRDWAATDLVLEAMGGLMYITGERDEPPLKGPGQQPNYLAGLHAYGATLAGLMAGIRDGSGQLIDLAIVECVGHTLENTMMRWQFQAEVRRRGNTFRSPVYPCQDGFVGLIMGLGEERWKAFVDLVGVPELLDERFQTRARRSERWDEIDPLILPWLMDHDKEWITREGQKRGLLFGAVRTSGDLLHSAQLASRHFFTEIDHPIAGTLKYPGPPYNTSQIAWRSARAPLLGESERASGENGVGEAASDPTPYPTVSDLSDDSYPTANPTLLPPDPTGAHYPTPGNPGSQASTLNVQPAVTSPPADIPDLPTYLPPLSGVRIADLTHYYAGPYSTRLLGDLGAEVIKVESLRHYDPSRGPLDRQFGRGYPKPRPAGDLFNQASNTNKNNRNKLGITLDLTRPAGVELFEDLVKVSDVVIESYSPGVMDRFGLGFERLRALRPDIIYVVLPAMGTTGPDRHYRVFGQSLEMLAGLTSLRGYDGGQPWPADINYGDPVAGVTAAGAVLLALIHRHRTGEGQMIDLSQLQTLVSLTGEYLMDAQLNGRDSGPIGNHHGRWAPHNCYPCRDTDFWAVIACPDDPTWRRLCAAIEQPELAVDPRFATQPLRKEHEAELDAILESWTRQHTRAEISTILQQHDVPAGPVNRTADLAIDPHFASRRFFTTISHPQSGTHAYPGPIWRLDRTPPTVRRPAPLLGQHTEQVLTELLGVTDHQLGELERQKIIGSYPTVDLWE